MKPETSKPWIFTYNGRNIKELNKKELQDALADMIWFCAHSYSEYSRIISPTPRIT